MHIAASSRINLDLERVANTLLQQNVKLHTFGRYYLGQATSSGLIFGYGVVDGPEIRRGLALLHKALVH